MVDDGHFLEPGVSLRPFWQREILERIRKAGIQGGSYVVPMAPKWKSLSTIDEQLAPL